MARFLRLGTLVLAATVFACPAARAAGAAASDSTSRRLLSVPSVHVHNVVARPVLVLAAGGALAAWAYGQENPDVAAARLDGPVGSRIADVGNFYGDGLVIGGAAAGLYAVGHLGHHAKTAALGDDLTEAFLFSTAVNWTMKAAFHRQRPNGGPHSFPSGHTTAAFCVVPVLGHHLGWKASVPAAVLATATGLGRIEAHKHFLSDVLAGAALGLACGDLVTGKGLLPGSARAVVSPGVVGVSVAF
jgi:membrane-associated phospholipid phosphatase